MQIIRSKKSQDTQQDDRLVKTLHALGDKTRFNIFKLMISDRNLCVSEIADELNISVPAVSQHFRIFELVGLVNRQRQGQKICYELKTDDKFLNNIKKLIES